MKIHKKGYQNFEFPIFYELLSFGSDRIFIVITKEKDNIKIKYSDLNWASAFTDLNNLPFLLDRYERDYKGKIIPHQQAVLMEEFDGWNK